MYKIDLTCIEKTERDEQSLNSGTHSMFMRLATHLEFYQQCLLEVLQLLQR